MTRYLFLLFISLGFSVCAQSFTPLKDATTAKKQIKEKTIKTKSIQGKFKEETFSTMFSSTKIASGILLYEKENKIRWEHLSPNKQIVLINGTAIRFQENGKEIHNSNSNRIVKKVQSLMLQLFSGDFLNEKDFNVSYFKSNTSYKLVLKPKNSRMAKYLDQVQMVFNKKTLSLESMVMQETESDKVVYTFNSIIFDQPIIDTKFQKF